MGRLYSLGDLRRCLVIAAVVGTLLNLVNQGPGAYGAWPRDWTLTARMLANYAIPFAVSSLGALSANQARAKQKGI